MPWETERRWVDGRGGLQHGAGYRLVKRSAGLTNFLAQGIMELNSAQGYCLGFSCEGRGGFSLGLITS